MKRSSDHGGNLFGEMWAASWELHNGVADRGLEESIHRTLSPVSLILHGTHTLPEVGGSG